MEDTDWELKPFKANRVMVGDALQLLRALPDACIDLTLTSPPYNLGNNHHTRSHRHQQYDDNLPEEVYQEAQIAVLNELWRVTKDSGSLLYNHKNRIGDGVSITPYTWLLKTPWLVKQELVWFNGGPNFDKIRFYPQTERVYWLAKQATTTLENVLSHNDVFGAGEWAPTGTKNPYGHTRAFPEQMAIDLLSCFPTAQMVLDPYCGSGTTLVAALVLGKRYLGFEIDPAIRDVAHERTQLAATGRSLIVERGGQKSLFAF